MWEMESPKQGRCHTLKEKNIFKKKKKKRKQKRTKIFKIVAGVKCRDKLENKLTFLVACNICAEQ